MATGGGTNPLMSDGKRTGPNFYNPLVVDSSETNITLGTANSNSRLLACLRCQQRKVKCDRKRPCSSCAKSQVDCAPVPVLPARRRKKRFAEAELLARLKRYENLLQNFGVNLDAINGESCANPLKGSTGTGTTTDDKIWAKKKDVIFPADNNVYTDIKNEFRDTEEILEGSSDDELIQSPITTTWDSISTNNAAALLFGSQHTNTNLSTLHPQPMDIMRLWQIFLDNVNPLTKIIHAPTVQKQILETSTNLENTSKDMEALLFSIYLLAITSIDDAQCRDSYGMKRSDLLAKYQFGAQQALLNAEFLRPCSLVLLQALVLYLLSLREGVDPRSVSCLGSLALRLAQQIGLHRDGREQKFTPFEVEMRRRVWWSIIVFNSRIAEFSGVGTAVLTHQWTTRLPSNVNDSDLCPDMREPPIDHKGPTEMIFVLTKYEIAEFLRRVRSTTIFDGCWHELSTSRISLSAKDKGIDELEKNIELKYLKYCDASIPFHFITVAMTKSAICKLRHVVHHPRLLKDRGASLPQDEKDEFFGLCLKMIEYSNLAHSNEGMKKFMWHVVVNKPLEGYINVLSELRYRTTGRMADRAWPQILECLHYFMLIKKWDNEKRYSALFMALSNMAIKAWEARATALRQTQPFVECPDTILKMQAYLDLWRSRKAQSPINDMSLVGTILSDQGYGVGPYLDTTEFNNYPTPNGTSNNLELSTLGSSLPTNDSGDWLYWNNLTFEYPLAGVDFEGDNAFSTT